MPKVSQKNEETAANGTAAQPNGKKGKGKVQKPLQVPGEPKVVVYEKVTTSIAQGDKAITVHRAKVLLGWEEIPDGAGKDVVPQFHDMSKKPIRCLNNLSNRPFDFATAMQYAQDILNKKWAGPNGSGGSVNGEAIIIGKYGSTLSAQKRLAGLVFAGQMWAGQGPTDQSAHWKTIWEKEPVMDSVVVQGVDEDPRTVQTIDNVQPRSPSDVLNTLGYFPERAAVDGVVAITGKDRIRLCNMLEHAVRLLWDRTGAKDDPYNSSLSNAEFIGWLQRHGGSDGRLVQAVKHIWEENKQGGIARFMSPGYAAALCYLMGCSASDGLRNGYGQLVDYADALPAPHDEVLDWSRWDAAQSFWVSLINGPDCMAVRDLRRPLETNPKARKGWTGFVFPESGKDKGSLQERMAALSAAWEAYADKGTVAPGDLHLEYDFDLTDEQNPVIASTVCESQANFGGIDTGGMDEEDKTDDDNQAPTPEEVQAEKDKIEAEKKQARLNEAEARLKAAREKKQREDALKATAPPSSPKPKTAKEIQADQTERARLADEELARQEAEQYDPSTDDTMQ